MTVTTTAHRRTPTTPGANPVVLGLRMLGNETGKALRVMWVHKAPLVFQLAMAGYLAYVISYIALLRMAAGLLEEMFTGTLEQSLLSPLRPWVASTGRLAAAMVEAVVTALFVAVFYLVVFAALDVELSLRWSALLSFAVTLADIAGFAMLIGGIALIVNSIGAIVHVIQSFIMFFNGAFVPVFIFPDWLETLAKVIVPTALSSDAVRQTLIDGKPLTQIWSNGTLPTALLHAAVLLTLGWTVYQAAIRRGLCEGRLGA